MQIDGDVLNISWDMKQDDIEELKSFVLPRLEYIEEIGFETSNEEFALSSSLFAFLISLKKTKPSIKIDILDLGEFVFEKYGKAHWIMI